MTKVKPEILPYGDSAFLIQFPHQGYDSDIIDFIQSVAARLSKTGEWEEIVTGYNSVLTVFSHDVFNKEAAFLKLWTVLKENPDRPKLGDYIEIPVCYGGAYGPDLKAVSKANNMSPTEIIRLHCKDPYRVCMMGFIPGFTFLSESPKALHHLRHSTPRLNVPAGSVGLAGWQTGIYGLESPGGWQLIGRTPKRIFDQHRQKPFFLKAGDSVKFFPIEASRFEEFQS